MKAEALSEDQKILEELHAIKFILCCIFGAITGGFLSI